MNALARRLDEILSIDHTANAVEFERRWHSWGEIDAARQAVEAVLAARRLNDDSRIAIMMRNHVAIVPAIYAVIARRSLVTLNPMLHIEKFAADIPATLAPAVIGVARDLDAPPVRHALETFGPLVIEMTGDPASPVVVRQERSDANIAAARVAAPGIALEMLTSGTTGTPKRVPMRRDAFEAAVFGAARFEKGREKGDAPQLRRGVQVLMAPLAHSSGILALMNAISAGRALTLLERFTVDDFRYVVSQHKIKVASTPPAALKMIYDAQVPKEELASLSAFRVGTAPLDPDLADAVYDRYGIAILQNYGATEFGGVAGWTLDDFRDHRVDRRGSVGRLNPGVQGRIIDPDTGAGLPYGVTGILELKSTQIGDGKSWTRTTDLARIDAENFLWIMGRADNAIIRGGFKVQPDEVVRALEAHPAVIEAAVVGLKDARLGQVPVAAFITAKGASTPSAAELSAFLKRTLTSYQVPVLFKPMAELPRTTSMKVDLQAMKALLQPLYETAA
ncbi:hypothetical protein CAF53_09130 [Sphingobium sp. LB126]|nr:hypothetical protein CAF53_09130 [Sphingobium sp. LB126]